MGPGEESSYQAVVTVLQVMSAVATTITYIRIMMEYAIPNVFLVLPILLFSLVLLQRVIVYQDKQSLSMFSGALLGFLSGFVCSIVNNTTTVQFVENATKYQRTMFSLEVLHIPVVLGTIMYTFCLVFERLPSLNTLFLLAATSTCASVLVTVAVSVWDGEDSDRSTVSYASLFICSIMEAFLVLLLPFARLSHRPWILSTAALLASIIWQNSLFDALVWDAAVPRFPIPGALTGTVIIFLSEFLLLRTPPMNHKKNSSSYSSMEWTDSQAPWELLLNAIMWFVMTYVVQRLSLTVILLGTDGHDAEAGSDVWLSSLLIIGFFCVVMPTFSITAEMRTMIVLAGLLFYICVTVTNGTLANAFFIDTILGLTILVGVQHHHTRKGTHSIV